MLRSRKLPLTLLLVGLLGIGWCLSDRYRVRAALFETGRLSSRADLEWAPDERPAWHRVDPPELLAPYTDLADEIAGGGTTRDRANRLLKYVAELGGPPETANDKTVPLAQTDDPSQIMASVQSRDFRGNCAHYSLIFHTLSLAAGIDARLVGLSDNRWIDGSGHAVNEVYLREESDWMAVDPLNHATFETVDGTPLSVLGLRDLLLEDRISDVRVRQGSLRARREGPSQLLITYRRQVPRLMYPGGNNVIELRGEIYGSWFAELIRLEAWPRQMRRAMENIFWNIDRRYIYVDRPEFDDRFVPFYVYRFCVALVLVSIPWLLWATFAGRRGRARADDPLPDPV